MPTIEEIAGNLDSIMGVKAVWGRSSEPIIGFGSRGDERTKGRAYFSQARLTAEKAVKRPYLITIGGGKHVPAELSGRAIELARATGVYGKTKAFIQNPAHYERLQQ